MNYYIKESMQVHHCTLLNRYGASISLIDWLRLHRFVHNLSLFLEMNLIETSGCGSRWSAANIFDVVNSPSTQ